MSLRSVNLNLMPVLRALLRERNLSRAAESLGLSQPAISASLTRLRAIYGDPLLVRNGREMTLTLRGHELIAQVEAVCDALEDLVGSERFEPVHSKRRFVVVSADYAVVTMGATLVKELGERAPDASIHFADVPNPAIELHVGEVDFYILPDEVLDEKRNPALRWTPLIEDEFVIVVGPNHRLARQSEPKCLDPSIDRYIMYHPALNVLAPPLLTPESARLSGRRVVAQIQQLSLLAPLAVDTGCAAIVPRRVAEYLQRFMELRVIEDGTLHSEIRFCLVWNVMRERDPAHRWLRSLILQHCSKLTAGRIGK